MLKRTKGRLLLTLLVITGLAGTLKDTSISNKERKSAITLMKETKGDVAKSVKGLSEKQLNFKVSHDRWSVKQCIYHISISEKNLWNMLEAAMKTPSNSEKRTEITLTDEQLIKMTEDRSTKTKTVAPLEPENTSYKSMNDALDAFKSNRASHIKYMKETTEDLRNHVVQMPFGWIDCYQLCLLIASHSARHLEQINEVKKDSHFPKQ
jgi:hypothetical protein